MYLRKPLALAILSLSASMAHSVTLTLDNPGFEDGMDGWTEVDPASISTDAYAGSSSLKITGSGGRVHQNVDITANTDYILRAYVKGAGELLINTGTSSGPGFQSTKFDVSTWTNVKVAFNSGSATSTQIAAKYSSGDVRFDEFAMWTTTTTTPTPTPTPTITPTPTPTPTGDLSSNLTPAENFDLSEWNLGVPIDFDGDGDSDTVSVEDLNEGYEGDYFYTGSDGGLVFKNYIDGPKTSTGTSYTRSELREILGGDEDAGDGDTDISPVNWVFSTTSSSVQNASGGVDGTLRATLAVNHVTSSGDGTHPGRTIIGQIHAKDNEPCRLYYRKLPGNTNGSIYFAHETKDGDEEYIEIIGGRSSSLSDPSDGIALNEVFSYEIKAEGDDLTVTIMRDGKSDVDGYINMSDSGYDESDQYMYFKAGLYTQNNTGEDDDYDQATFYSIETSHD